MDPAGGSIPSSTPSSPLVGRDREQALLRDAVDALFSGRGHLVLIAGDAGVGKTALVRWVSTWAAGRGIRVLTGGCYDLTTTPPYGPWREALEETRVARPGHDHPHPFADADDAADNQTQADLFEHVYAYLVALTDEQPIVVVLEDLHWSDPPSLMLLRSLARRVATAPLLLIVTYRSHEITRQHDLYHLLPLLVRETDAVRLDLTPLDESAIRTLISTTYHLSTGDEERLVAYLVDHTEGNPFFIGEVLRTLETDAFLMPTTFERHACTSDETVWQLGDLERAPVPPLVRQVIDGRLSRLGERDHAMLEIAAVIGHEVRLDVWAPVSGVDDEDLLNLIERAIDQRFLLATPDGTAVRFVHALIRETLYAGLLPPRRRAWHRTVGKVLVTATGPWTAPLDPDAVAYHFKQAGDERAIDWLIRAGERAQRSYAWSSAVTRFEEAIRLLEPDAERVSERGWLLYRVGKLLRFDDTARGIAYLQEAASVAAAVHDETLSAYARFDQGMLRCVGLDLRHGLPGMVAGIDALDALSRRPGVAESPQIAAWVADAVAPVAPVAPVAGTSTPDTTVPLGAIMRRGTFALWLAWTGHFQEALQIAEPYVAETATIPEAADGYGDACNALGTVYAALGRPDDARSMFARARAVYQSLRHHVLEGVATSHDLQQVVLVYEPESVDERRHVADDAIDAWLRGVSAGIVVPHHARLPLLLLEGAWDEAHDILDAVPESMRTQNRHMIGVPAAMLAANRGDLEVAWARVREGVPDGPATLPGTAFFVDYVPVLQHLAATMSLDAGDRAGARDWIEAYDHWLAWSGSIPGRAESRLLWARVHAADGQLADAVDAARDAVRLASAPRQPLALLAAQRMLGSLARALGDYVDAQDQLQASLALAERCVAPFERAQTLLELAAVLAATGQSAQAQARLDEAQAICEPLGAMPLLSRIDACATRLLAAIPAHSYPMGLTAREVEVLRLVAQGLSDADVAEQLFLARRTINTHLTSIYTKLGVNSRAAATRFAVEHGLT